MSIYLYNISFIYLHNFSSFDFLLIALPSSSKCARPECIGNVQRKNTGGAINKNSKLEQLYK
jgi:hypothetical protein